MHTVIHTWSHIDLVGHRSRRQILSSKHARIITFLLLVGLRTQQPAPASEKLREDETTCAFSITLNSRVREMRFSGSGDRLFALDMRGRVHAIETGQALAGIIFDGSPASLQSLAISPVGDRLALGGCIQPAKPRRGVNRFVGADPAESKWGIIVLEIQNEGRTTKLFGERFEGGNLVFSPDGRRIASSNANGVGIWDLSGQRITQRLPQKDHGLSRLCFSNDGNVLAWADDSSGRFGAWELASGKELSNREWRGMQPQAALAFSHDDRVLAAGSLDHAIRIVDLQTSKMVAVLHAMESNGCRDRVFDLRYVFKPKYLVSAHMDQTLRFWKVDEKYRLVKSIKLLQPAQVRFESAALSCDGTFVAAECIPTNPLREADDAHESAIVLWRVPLGTMP